MKHFLLFTVIIIVSLSNAALAQSTGIGTTIPTDQLHTTGTVRFEGYRGPGARLVQIDSSGRLIVTGAGAIFSATPGAVIPDNGCAVGNGVVSTITVSGQPTAVPSAKIAVRVNITHPAVNDLRILLTAPNGAILMLMAGTASAGANFTGTIFTDAAQGNVTGTAAAAPYTGKFKPTGGTGSTCLLTPTVSTFGAIGGGSIIPNGTWTLRVYDGNSTNTGTLNAWDISFSGPESFATFEQNNYIPKFSAGNLAPSAIYQNPSTGNVGINTGNPTYPLTLAGLGGNGIVQQDNANGVEVGTYTNAGGGWLQTYTNHPLYFATNNSSAQMVLNVSGNLGIGLPNPANRLHVAYPFPSLLALENTATLATNVNADLVFKTGNYFTGLIRARGTGSNSSALSFWTFASPGMIGLQERLTIADGGNVGINQTAPNYTLDVSGNFRTTGVALIGSTVQIGGGSPAAGRVLAATDATGNAAWRENVGFRARLNAATNIVWPATYTLAGLTEDYDDGSDLNNTTGIFTAPAAGMYSFTVQVNHDPVTNQPNCIKAMLYINGVIANMLQQPYPAMPDAYADYTMSFTYPTKLVPGDQVKVLIESCNVYDIALKNPTLFSGYRVY